MIDRSTIDRIMASADIVDVVKDFVTLRKSGTNYKGLCPFHDERTPSFMVSPAKQLCKCFSCGKGGNVVKFLMEHEQLTYPEALKWLAKKYGIEVRERELSAEQKEAATERESMFVVNEFARDFFVRTLHESPDGLAIGMAYFRSRGLRDDIIRKFQLGYSPEGRDAFSREAKLKGYQSKYLVKTGLCLESSGGNLHDRYASRVIFPVHTISGRVVAFGGRTLLSKEEQKRRSIGKYVNSPESEIYSKKRELYGLYQAKSAIAKHDRVFLVEGYLDVISMYQSGIENVVASSGTSLTTEQVRLIHRFTNNVTVLYDGDAAGIHAALRGVDMLLAEGLNIQVLLLPDGEDPDSFAQSHTADELRNYIEEHQTDFIRFKTELLLRDSKGDPLRRASVIKDVVQSIAAIPDNIVREMYVHELAGRMGVDENTIVNEVAVARKRIREEQRNEAERERQRQLREQGQQQGQLQPGQQGQYPQGAAAATGGAGTEMPPQSQPQQEEIPIFDDQGNVIGMEVVDIPAQGAAAGASQGVASQGAAAQQQPTAQDVARYASKSKAQRLLEGCERQLVEAVVRFGGLPLVLKPEVVEQRFGKPLSEEEKAAEEEARKQQANVIVEDPDSPLVAPYVYDSLVADDLELQLPLHQSILVEAANLADEAYEVRRAALDKGVEHKDAPPFFDALNYFRMHSDINVVQEAEALTDDRYLLSTSQSKMYTPDERRLYDIIPRLVNDYKHAYLGIEREQLMEAVRQMAVQNDEKELRRVMERLQELRLIEVEFAKELGGRVIGAR